MKNFNLIKYKNYFLGFSGIMIVLSFILVGVLGLKQGIDLRGGMQWEIKFSDTAANENAIKQALRSVKQEGEQSVRGVGEGTFFIRLPNATQEEYDAYRVALKNIGDYTELNFSNIGPTIGDELRKRAITAILLVLLGISLYIAYAFRKVSKPISSWKYGFATLISLFHDVVIPTGLLAILGAWKGIEIDTNFIVALLVVMGFSVHDTIVVFDRIRENLIVRRGKDDFAEIINISVRETFARSINTTLTLIIVLVALLIFGPSSLFYFVLTILVGTIFGTYSSIFLASPILYLWSRKSAK
ncbi:MAG: Protein-export membrane protein SecF [Parcubacteria group bacterium LiPW_41]|nr:MAG: Protein-export membrane protein SecF [Parcubacteria group bacterium LiPW_41]